MTVGINMLGLYLLGMFMTETDRIEVSKFLTFFFCKNFSVQFRSLRFHAMYIPGAFSHEPSFYIFYLSKSRNPIAFSNLFLIPGDLPGFHRKLIKVCSRTMLTQLVRPHSFPRDQFRSEWINTTRKSW
jgi:hypothetical protein